MNRFFTGLVLCIYSTLLGAQNFVDTVSQNKNVLLEGFGGVNCYFCAEADATAQNLHNSLGDRVLWINIHSGVFAEPNGNEPDFRTSYGDATYNLSGMTTYPAGMINRRYFSSLAQNSGNLAIEHQSWATAADTILNETAQVNIAARSELNISSRQIKVIVETYYTANSPTSVNRIYAALLLDSLIGPQEGANVYNPTALDASGNYTHRNLFFDYVSSGLLNNTTTAGTFRADTFYYNLPNDFNGTVFPFNSPKIAVWVADSSGINVLNAAMSEMTLISDFSDAAGLLNVEWDADFDLICGTESAAVLEIENIGNNDIDSIIVHYDILTGTTQDSFLIVLDSPLATGQRKNIQLPIINNLSNYVNTVEFTVSYVNANSNSVIEQFFKEIRQAEVMVSDSNNAVFNMYFDAYPDDIRWTLIDETAAETILADSNYSVTNTMVTQNFSVEEGHCYALKVTDRFGDGLCCGFGQGYFELRIGSLQIFKDSEFDFESGTKFIFHKGTIAVNHTDNIGFNATMYPNPAKDITNIKIDSPSDNDATLEIYNAYGQLLRNLNIYLNSGETNFSIDTNGFSPGLYLVKLRQGEYKKTLKLVIAS